MRPKIYFAKNSKDTAMTTKELIIDSVKSQFEVFQKTEFSWYGELEIHALKSRLFSSFAFFSYRRDISEFVSASEFVSDHITDGSGDKGIDFCYIDLDEGKVYIGQNYLSKEWGKAQAPADKVSKLFMGADCLLSGQGVQGKLKEKHLDLINAIQKGNISEIVIMYTHNAFVSEHIHNELQQVTSSVNLRVRDLYSEFKIAVVPKEVGLNTIHESLREESSIVIEDKIDLPLVERHLEEEGEKWESVVISVPGKWIAELYKKYGDDLCAANFREFMGKRGERGINSQIRDTAMNDARNFWAFNNGVTVVVNEIIRKDGVPVSVVGISIANGAQTVGSLFDALEIGTLDIPISMLEMPKVMLRIIECSNDERMINYIVEYNNTQNDIRPQDKHSKDPTQKTLHKQFKEYGIHYSYRRPDKNSGNLPIVELIDMAKILYAFHFDVQVPFRGAKKIFKEDNVYKKTFPDRIQSHHCLVVYALYEAIDRYKKELKKSEDSDSGKKTQIGILSQSSAKLFVLRVIGNMMEDICGITIPDKFLVSPKRCDKTIFEEMVNEWLVFVKGAMPFIVDCMEKCGNDNEIGNDWEYHIPRSREYTDDVCRKMALLFRSNKEINPIHKKISELLELRSEEDSA